MTLAITNQLTESEARSLTANIKQGLQDIWSLIEEAYQGRAWNALGYSSWDEYCEAEFKTSRIKLPRSERTQVIASMRGSGMSTRAIASATGLGVGTVHASGVQNRTPEPVTGLDGKTYKPITRAKKTEAEIASKASTDPWPVPKPHPTTPVPQRGSQSQESASEDETLDAELVDETPESAPRMKITPGMKQAGRMIQIDKLMEKVLDSLYEMGKNEPEHREDAIYELERYARNCLTTVERIKDHDQEEVS